MKLHSLIPRVVLAFSLAYGPTATAKDDDDSVLLAQLAQIREQCEKQHEQNKQREQDLETAKADASLSPQKMEEVEEKIQTLKTAIAKTDSFLAEPLPATKAERESYLKQVSSQIATTRQFESTITKDLGRDPASRMEAVLSRLGGAEDFKPKFGAWDWEKHAYNPDPNAPIAQGQGTHFFGLSAQLPKGAISTNDVKSEYFPTTVDEANAIAIKDHGTGGGIMLEGSALGDLPATISSVDYDGSVNALVLNGDLIYFVKIPPWSLATMCRAIGTDRNGLLGVSETSTEGLVFGNKPELYKESDLANELMLADKFLGDIIFGRPNGWTQGYKFPTTQPKEAKVTSDMLVRFAFGNFKFANNDGQLSVISSSLEVRMLPVSKVPSPTGQMLPNYDKLDNGWVPPEAFVANARILTKNVDHFRREPLIEKVFAYGEAAAILRSIKESVHDLNALADQIETGEAK